MGIKLLKNMQIYKTCSYLRDVVGVPPKLPLVLVWVLLLYHEHSLTLDHLLDDGPDDLSVVALMLLSVNSPLVYFQSEHKVDDVALGQLDYDKKK